MSQGGTCHFCGKHDPMIISANHWVGDHYERVMVCGEHCFGPAKQIKSAPRRPRKPKSQPVAYGDWGQLAAFMGHTRKGSK